jgi:glycosyltransferase involved in cell wall biosynthesis
MKPKISGFTIIRNGVEFDYPFLESIESMRPICDEIIINVGKSTDSTLEVIKNYIFQLKDEEQKKFKILETIWPIDNPEKRKGGLILSEQTNLALNECCGDWCLYLQADEVLHEKDYDLILDYVKKYLLDSSINAFVFHYEHFYATYNIVQKSRSAYRREIRMIRNYKDIVSIGDAQSFRHKDGKKITSILIPAKIYHYGWVKHQEVMKQKTGFMDTLYHSEALASNPATQNNYVFKRFVGLKTFTGSHPQVMKKRIENTVTIDLKKTPFVFTVKDIWKLTSDFIEKLTGIIFFEYKNYKLKK